MIRVLDKLDKSGCEVLAEGARRGRDVAHPDQVDLVGRYLEVTGRTTRCWTRSRVPWGRGPWRPRGGDELREVAENVRAAGVRDENWAVDPDHGPGLDYYTGPVWETVLHRRPEIGSVAGGRALRWAHLALHARCRRALHGHGGGGGSASSRPWKSLGMISPPDRDRACVMSFAPEMGADYQDLARPICAMRPSAPPSTSARIAPSRPRSAMRPGRRSRSCSSTVPDDRDAGVVQVKDMRARTQEAVALDEVVGSVAKRFLGGDLAQLVRAPDCGSGGPGFNSRSPPQLTGFHYLTYRFAPGQSPQCSNDLRGNWRFQHSQRLPRSCVLTPMLPFLPFLMPLVVSSLL